jgi:hypothetical protein
VGLVVVALVQLAELLFREEQIPAVAVVEQVELEVGLTAWDRQALVALA